MIRNARVSNPILCDILCWIGLWSAVSQSFTFESFRTQAGFYCAAFFMIFPLHFFIFINFSSFLCALLLALSSRAITSYHRVMTMDLRGGVFCQTALHSALFFVGLCLCVNFRLNNVWQCCDCAGAGDQCNLSKMQVQPSGWWLHHCIENWRVCRGCAMWKHGARQ